MKFDKNETAMLKALYAEDPDSEQWIWPMMLNTEQHGADAVGAESTGKLSVAKRLKKRGLVESDGALRSGATGICLTERGHAEALRIIRSGEVGA